MWKLIKKQRGGFYCKSLCCFVTCAILADVLIAQSKVVKPEEDEIVDMLIEEGLKNQSDILQVVDGKTYVLSPIIWDKFVKKVKARYGAGPLAEQVSLYEVAARLANRLNSSRHSAVSYYYIGELYYNAGSLKLAEEAYIKSQRLAEAVKSHSDLVHIYSDLASLYLYSQDIQKAEAYARKSIEVLGLAEDSLNQLIIWPPRYSAAKSLATLGYISRLQGEYGRAIELIEESNKTYEFLGKQSSIYYVSIGENYAEIGRVYQDIGNFQQSLLYYYRALELAKKYYHRALIANILNSIGVLFLYQEDYVKARDCLNQSLSIYVSLKDKIETSRVLLNLGVASQRQNELDKAFEYLMASLTEAKAVGYKDVIIASGEGLSVIYKQRANFVAAHAIIDESYNLAKEIDDKSRIIELLWRKSEILILENNIEQSAIVAKMASDMASNFGQPILAYVASNVLGQIYLKQGKLDLAFQALSEAITQVEEMRQHVAGREHEKNLFFENKVPAYHSMIELLVRQHKLMDALSYAEMAKGRVLLDVLKGGRVSMSKVLTDQERKEDERLNRRIVSLNNEIRDERVKTVSDNGRISHLNVQLAQARLQYSAFQNLLYVSHPELKLKQGKLPPLTEQSLKDLLVNERTALLEYVVTAERLHLFVATKDRLGDRLVLKRYPIEVKEEELLNHVRKFHRMMATRQISFTQTAAELYDLLLKPAEAQLSEVDTLCIIPDGYLWETPFQALRMANNRYLIEKFSIYYAPSLSTLKSLSERKSRERSVRPQSLLAFGNPFVGSDVAAQLTDARRGENFEPLPDAETEVRMLSRIFGANHSEVFTGFRADERMFKTKAPSYTTLHFATHGILDDKQPLFSYLLLSKPGEKAGDGIEEDGLLEAREILELDLKADLVVLSACETARGKVSSGEGVIGMSWAFLVAGSRTTVVSQWKVGSASTADLMVDFYGSLKEKSKDGKITTANALRAASMKMMGSKRFNHPYYWAGFIAVGEN